MEILHVLLYLLIIWDSNATTAPFSLLGNQFPWIKATKENVGLPPTIEIFKLNTTSSPFRTNLTGSLTRFDFISNPNIELKIAHTEDEKSLTPMQWAEKDEHIVYSVLNGGYFNMVLNESASFICSGSVVYHPNSINKQPKNNIYPTIGTFGRTKNHTFSIHYVYSFGQEYSTYVYAEPNPIPGPQPIKSNGKYWQIEEGIGAGSILVKNETLVKGNPQNFDPNYMINMRHPRSGICYDKYGRLYFIAIDGRYQGSAGLTFEEFGILMRDLGCKDALNLDGGGSTLLYTNNYVLSHYSDPKPRPVVSAIVVRDRFLKKHPNLVSE